MNELSNSTLVPLFWDELEDLLGPIFEPIVGPLFDFLRVDANRLMLLSMIVSLCIVFVVITYVAYELPVIFRWMAAGSASLDGKPPPARTKRTAAAPPTRYSTKATSAKREGIEKLSSAESIGDIHVSSVIEKNRDETALVVSVTNQSEHQIEMVVVDLKLPPGIDVMTGSFRMQRIGTIQPGDSSAARFRLRHNFGSLAELGGQVEFMSSSYEITKVNIPSPELE